MGGRGSSSGGSDLGGGGGGGGGTVYSTTDLTSERGANQASVDQTLSVLRDISEQYGFEINNTVVANMGKSNTMAYYEPDTGIMGINQTYFNAQKMDKAYDSCVDRKFHPPRGNKTGTEAVVSHEVGHALTEEAGRKNGMGLDQMSKQIVSESIGGKTKADTQQKAQRISGYAKKSNAECVAEAFADVYCNGSKAKKESHAVVNTLKKYLGR